MGKYSPLKRINEPIVKEVECVRCEDAAKTIVLTSVITFCVGVVNGIFVTMLILK